MGRPPLAVGTPGDIMTRELPEGGWRARVYVRDADGRRREVSRWRPTKAAAVKAVRDAMNHRSTADGVAEVGPDSTVSKLAGEWLAEVGASKRKAVNSKAAYRSNVDNHVVPALGGLRLREVTVPRLDAALRTVNAKSGPGAAKIMRTVLSGMFDMAARHGAVDRNPVRDAGRGLERDRAPMARALTLDEQWRVMDAPRSDPRAVELDIPDLVDWMLGTGMRVGEALAVRDEVLDLDAGTVEVNATVVRVGPKEERDLGIPRGLYVQTRPKTAAGWRVLALPPDLVDIVRRRRSELRVDGPARVRTLDADGNAGELVNPGILLYSPRGQLRDARNTNRDLREVLDRIDAVRDESTGRITSSPFGWVHSHTFRKTVATRMEEAGCTPREVADQLGHSRPSMTQDVYFGRNVVTAKAATILTRPNRTGNGTIPLAAEPGD